MSIHHNTSTRVLCGFLITAATITLVIATAVGQGTVTPDNAPRWANPSAIAVRKVSPTPSAQREPNFMSNLDCDQLDYRLVSGNTMQTGCFTSSAFGLIDSDSDQVIFNGTDEALQLLPYSPHEVLVAWPHALDLVSLEATPTGGSLVSLYKNPLASLHDQRNITGQLVSKQLTLPPELPLRDQTGHQVIINPQTMAFSDGGSWLVAETVTGSFVRINLATLDILAFGPSFTAPGDPATLKSQVAVSNDGRFAAINNEAAGSFKVYDLAGCGSPSVTLNATDTCPSYNYRSFARSQVSGLQSIRHVRFVNQGLLSFEASASTSVNSGTYELAPSATISSLTDYLGLGDSYTSGEGAFDYLSGTDTSDNFCHLSRHSYPLLLTHDLFSSSGGHSVACSGATITDVASHSDDYRGQVRGVNTLRQLRQSQIGLLDSVTTNFLPGYIAQHNFVQQYQPRIVTVSVGGNDIGFGDMLENCVGPHVSRHLSNDTCFNTYEDREELVQLIDRTGPRWIALYSQLKAESPGAQVYAIGYPQIVTDRGSCALNVHLNKSELEFTQEAVDYLNSAVAKAASTAGVNYVDISQALVGHRLCETTAYNVAVNGLTAGRDGSFLGIKVFGKESYHPNSLGQSLIESSILRQTHNLTDTHASPIPATNSQNILEKPKTGRVITTRIPASVTSKIVKRGSSQIVHLSGAPTGTTPHTPYTVRLDGPAGPQIGTITSDNEGNIDGSITIPDSTESGSHTIDIAGPLESGNPADITQPTYVTDDGNDADGDGRVDETDSCPYVINSGQDTDDDGVDDACDDTIGQPPAPKESDTSSHSTAGGGTIDGSSQTPSATSTTPPPTPLGSIQLTPNTSGVPLITEPANAGSTLTQAPTIATNFNASSNLRTAGQSRASPLSLGNKTINPNAVMGKSFKPPSAKHVGFPPLHAIRWLPWFGLAVILLLVLVVAAWLIDFMYGESIQGHPRNGTTIFRKQGVYKVVSARLQ